MQSYKVSVNLFILNTLGGAKKTNNEALKLSNNLK